MVIKKFEGQDCYLHVGAKRRGEGARLVVVVEPQRRVHADVAVALVDVVEGEEAGAHQTCAGQNVLRVGLNLRVKTTKPLSLLSDIKRAGNYLKEGKRKFAP